MQIFLVICLFYTLMGTFQSILTNMVGFLYPAYKSLEALESDNLGDDKHWLTYWVCFSCFMMFDQLAEKLFVKRIIPFYFFLKLAFLIYLFHPSTSGAKNIYRNLILPFVRGHQMEVQNFIREILLAGQNMLRAEAEQRGWTFFKVF